MEKEKKYKIVASDLDGTLLSPDQKISAENFQAIAEMHRLGIEFVPTTGRTLSEIPKELIESQDVRYIITSDGGAVWDKALGKMVLTYYIPKETVEFIFNTVKPYNTYWLVHESGDNHYHVEKHNADGAQALDKINGFDLFLAHPVASFYSAFSMVMLRGVMPAFS